MNTYQCPVCGKEFKDFPSQINKSGCCSRKCSNQIPRPRRPMEERFWEKVDKRELDDCWEWMGHRNHHGYGTFRIGADCTVANRVAWVLTFGEIPEGQNVLHNCDNPACCNPRHLWLGTIGENNRDRHSKGRTAWGERMPRAKLTTEIVKTIREEYSRVRHLSQRLPGRLRQWELAKRFGVKSDTISRIVNRKIWKQV